MYKTLNNLIYVILIMVMVLMVPDMVKADIVDVIRVNAPTQDPGKTGGSNLSWEFAEDSLTITKNFDLIPITTNQSGVTARWVGVNIVVPNTDIPTEGLIDLVVKEEGKPDNVYQDITYGPDDPFLYYFGAQPGGRELSLIIVWDDAFIETLNIRYVDSTPNVARTAIPVQDISKTGGDSIVSSYESGTVTISAPYTNISTSTQEDETGKWVGLHIPPPNGSIPVEGLVSYCLRKSGTEDEVINNQLYNTAEPFEFFFIAKPGGNAIALDIIWNGVVRETLIVKYIDTTPELIRTVPPEQDPGNTGGENLPITFNNNTLTISRNYINIPSTVNPLGEEKRWIGIYIPTPNDIVDSEGSVVIAVKESGQEDKIYEDISYGPDDPLLYYFGANPGGRVLTLDIIWNNQGKERLIINYQDTTPSIQRINVPQQDADKTGGENITLSYNNGVLSVMGDYILIPYSSYSGETAKWIGISIPRPIDDIAEQGIVDLVVKESGQPDQILSAIEYNPSTPLTYKFKASSLGKAITLEIIWNGIAQEKLDIVYIDTSIPRVISKNPPENSVIDETELNPTIVTEIDNQTRYFLAVTFEDIDGTLKLNADAINKMKLSTVYSEGGSQSSIIDKEVLDYINELDSEAQTNMLSKYLLSKDTTNHAATLKIPIKKIRSQTRYTVNLQPGIVVYANGKSNEAITWSFSTIAVPTISNLLLGSVGEDYDEDDPIIIKGDFFYSGNVAVKFNDIYAYEVNIHDDEESPYLEVYLPRGRDRLEPGVYDVTVINNDNPDYSQTLYASFSVIESSNLPIPQDGIRVKSHKRIGIVEQSVKTSADILLLKSSSVNYGYISLDLDKLMGEDVLVRKIKFSSDMWNSIINTTSKWANITLYGIRPGSYAYDPEDMELRLGRIEPTLVPTLKRGMLYSSLKSEFIELGGQNISFDKADVEIPYTNSNGQRIRVLRYDEIYRQWFEQPFSKDLLNSKVFFTTNKPGIFVVVE